MRLLIFLVVGVWLSPITAYTQTLLPLIAEKIAVPIQIDGELDEEVW